MRNNHKISKSALDDRTDYQPERDIKHQSADWSTVPDIFISRHWTSIAGDWKVKNATGKISRAWTPRPINEQSPPNYMKSWYNMWNVVRTKQMAIRIETPSYVKPPYYFHTLYLVIPTGSTIISFPCTDKITQFTATWALANANREKYVPLLFIIEINWQIKETRYW